MEFEGAANAKGDEPCKPIRWGSWSPPCDWVCRDGTQTRCQMRQCQCHEGDTCYDYFQNPANGRREYDFAKAQCGPQVPSGTVCHDANGQDGTVTKNRQTRCETRPYVCHCEAEKNSICPHCTSWPRTPAGAEATAKCGCGYKGSLSRQCVMGADRCSCKWSQPSTTCKKIEWQGWTPWAPECPVQCAPQGGRAPKKIYRSREQLCNEDLSECQAVAKLGCIGPRGQEQELCKNYKQCECTEPTDYFVDPIAAEDRGAVGGGSYQADSPPEPAKIAASEATSAPTKTTKKTSRRSRRKLENMRKGKGASIFSNLRQGVTNIFKGRKRRRRRKDSKRGSQ